MPTLISSSSGGGREFVQRALARHWQSEIDVVGGSITKGGRIEFSPLFLQSYYWGTSATALCQPCHS